MKFNIFIPDIILKDFAYVFKKNFNVDCIWIKNKKYDYKKYNAIVVNGGFDCNKIFLKKFPNLKIISVFGVGYSGVDLDYCKKNKIIITNTPKVLTNDVADLALGLMISLSRKIYQGHNFILDKKWIKKPFTLSTSLTKKTIGVVGMGAIGKAFSKRASSLSMNVFYHGPNKKNLKYKYFKNLKIMAKNIDIMVVTCVGGEKTKNLINKNVLNFLSPSSLIINVSRGSVINENDLLKSLKTNKIAGAALDVFNDEPAIHKDYYKLKNVILSPHNASGTNETRLKMAVICSQNIYHYLSNGKVYNKI